MKALKTKAMALRISTSGFVRILAAKLESGEIRV